MPLQDQPKEATEVDEGEEEVGSFSTASHHPPTVSTWQNANLQPSTQSSSLEHHQLCQYSQAHGGKED